MLNHQILENKLYYIYEEGNINSRDDEIIINNEIGFKGILEYAKLWINEEIKIEKDKALLESYEEVVEYILSCKEVSSIAKDIIIIAYLSRQLKLTGKMFMFKDVENQSPAVTYYIENQFITGYMLRKDLVWPLVKKGDLITNEGQYNVKVKNNLHFQFLKQLKGQYEILQE